MNAGCCHGCHEGDPQRGNPAYRRVLWIVLAINAVMFGVEIGAGLTAGSASLQADALDFLGDAANYAISLFVVGMALRYRAIAALVKGSTMGVFGLWVIGVTAWHAWHGTIPQAATMGAVGFTALLANIASFGLLWWHRAGDANMRSVWTARVKTVFERFPAGPQITVKSIIVDGDRAAVLFDNRAVRKGRRTYQIVYTSHF